MSEDQTTKLAEFIAITQLDTEKAKQYLRQVDWDVSVSSLKNSERETRSAHGRSLFTNMWGHQSALEIFYAAENDDDTEPDFRRELERSRVGRGEETLAGPSILSSSAGSISSRGSSQAASSVSKKKFATIADFRNERDVSPMHGGPPDPDNFFTGGEKSGLAVENPDQGRSRRPARLISDIFRQAQHVNDNGDSDIYDDNPQQQSQNQFTGTGYMLGGEGTPSRTIISSSDSSSRDSHAKKETRRTLYFWRNGFSVGEDGELYRYDDPANVTYLEALRSGRAPLALLDVQDGEDVCVDVYRKDEDYNPPKKKKMGFSGEGVRLGSPIPGEVGTSSASTTAGPTTNPPAASGLGTSGDIALQLRLGNGQAVRLRFDSTSPVQTLYDYIEAEHPTTRGYVLQTTFPNQELSDKTKILKDAGVAGAVVVQKWL